MTFLEFSQRVLEPLEATASKLEQTRILADFFKEIKGQRLQPYIYLSLGQLGPVYANPQTNFGLAFMLQALAQTNLSEVGSLFDDQAGMNDIGISGSTHFQDQVKQLKKRYKKLGDVGLLAQEVMTEYRQGNNHLQKNQTKNSNQSPTTPEVFNELITLTQTTGEGSQEEKVKQISELLRKLEPLEAKFVSRILVGNLRLGFQDKTVLDALSWYVSGDKSQRPLLDEVYQRHPDIGQIANEVVNNGLSAALKLDVALGVPVIPALADRLKTSQAMIEKMGQVIAEPKYDGTRVQIHWDAKQQQLHTFTRNLEENTHMFPELPRLLSEIKAESVIFDSEAVGYDPNTGELLPFQQTIRRKRKHDVEQFMTEIPLRFFVFDILFVDDRSLLKEPLRKRRQILESVVGDGLDSSLNNEPHYQAVGRGDLLVSAAILTKDPEKLRKFHAQQLAAGYEGAMVKQADGLYEPGRRAFNWVKFKESEGTKAKLNDTIDAVVVGYYYGRGKRTKFGVGAFLVAILNEKTDHLVTIAKIGTGLSDEQWQELKSRCDEVAKKFGKQPSAYQVEIPEQLEPDVVLFPDIVVEIAADEITKSPAHTAGQALRFPRLVKFRDDKSVEQITTLAELQKIKVAG